MAATERPMGLEEGRGPFLGCAKCPLSADPQGECLQTAAAFSCAPAPLKQHPHHGSPWRYRGGTAKPENGGGAGSEHRMRQTSPTKERIKVEHHGGDRNGFLIADVFCLDGLFLQHRCDLTRYTMTWTRAAKEGFTCPYHASRLRGLLRSIRHISSFAAAEALYRGRLCAARRPTVP